MGEALVSQHLPASHLRPWAPRCPHASLPTLYQVPKALLITGVFVTSSKKKGLESIACPHLILLHNWNIAWSLRAKLLEGFFCDTSAALRSLTKKRTFYFWAANDNALSIFLSTCSLHHLLWLDHCLCVVCTKCMHERVYRVCPSVCMFYLRNSRCTSLPFSAVRGLAKSLWENLIFVHTGLP
jgi:hypothetical protein